MANLSELELDLLRDKAIQTLIRLVRQGKNITGGYFTCGPFYNPAILTVSDIGNSEFSVTYCPGGMMFEYTVPKRQIFEPHAYALELQQQAYNGLNESAARAADAFIQFTETLNGLSK
jgi:hypothetical protein